MEHLSHAYIIAGGDKSGRLQRAQTLCQQYLCKGEYPPCGHCTPCQKVEKDIHPDVIHVGAGEEKLDIATIRDLGRDAYIRPNEANRKIYILHDAHRMNDNSQNAMLKLLEDGPEYAAFLLLVDNEGKLLTTVRSRCETIRLEGAVNYEEDAQLWEEAGIFAAILLEGPDLDLMEHSIALEKWKRDELIPLCHCTIERIYKERKPSQTKSALALIAQLQQVIPLLEANVAPGHALGKLAATRPPITP